MTGKETLRERGVAVRQYEDSDALAWVADFGPDSDGSVDVVGDTAIVVVDGEQYELPVEANARAYMSNGVLTVEVTE